MKGKLLLCIIFGGGEEGTKCLKKAINQVGADKSMHLSVDLRWKEEPKSDGREDEDLLQVLSQLRPFLMQVKLSYTRGVHSFNRSPSIYAGMATQDTF